MIIRPTLPETPNYTTPRGTINSTDVAARIPAGGVMCDSVEPTYAKDVLRADGC